MNSAVSTSRGPVVRVFDCHVAREVAGQWQFLLLKRASDRIYGGDWRMVGGKLEASETAWQGCLRELAEETALPVQRLLVVPYVNRFYEWRHDRINDIPVFVAVTSHEKPRLDGEHVDYAWLPAEQAAERLPWPGQREGILAARALLAHNRPLQRHLEIDLPAPPASVTVSDRGAS